MVETILERVIDDLDIKEFVIYFLLPHKPEDLLEHMTGKPITPEYEACQVFEEMITDSLKYMVEELVTLKRGKTIEAYRQAIQELTNKPDLKQTVEKFVRNDYYLLFWIRERKKVIEPYFSWFSRESVEKLARVDYQILKSYRDSIESTQEIEGDSSLLLKLKEFGSSVIRDENYQTSKGVIEDMENYGEAKLGIRYDYFDTVKGVQHIKFDTSEKWKEMLDWFFHKTKTTVNRLTSFGLAYFFPTRREKFHVKALEFLIQQNAPLIEKTLEYRKPMDFLLGATKYIEKIESSGIPLTYPSFTKEEGFLIKELYNPCLLLQEGIKGKEDIVPNDVESCPEQNVTIITGPNNTGKSVYVKSIGLAYVLAQNGLPIPARDAQLSELDGVYTHFIHPEDITLGEGSYLDELRRIKELLQKATPRSLLIVDEPIRGTSPEDAKEMSLRFIKGFTKLKAPTFFTTHLHDITKEVEGWKGIRNLRTEIELDGEEIRPTYRIIPGKAGKSYGIEIAEKFGLSEEDILRMIEEKISK
jgi:DNA mismatch repair ATPase MutS